MKSTRNFKHLNHDDVLFIEALRNGDNELCRRFFYGEIGGVLHKIRADLFQCRVEFDELVNELYLYLSRDGWAKIDSFNGNNGCRLRTWMISVAWRYFIRIRERLMHSTTAPDESATADGLYDDDMRIQIALDVNAVLAKMPNRRYAEILRMLLIDGYAPSDVADMLGTKLANVYNLKHRAIIQFMEVYGDRIQYRHGSI